ncbi:unnamed protein product, partial [Cuscuta epithymum]
MGFYL